VSFAAVFHSSLISHNSVCLISYFQVTTLSCLFFLSFLFILLIIPSSCRCWSETSVQVEGEEKKHQQKAWTQSLINTNGSRQQQQSQRSFNATWRLKLQSLWYLRLRNGWRCQRCGFNHLPPRYLEPPVHRRRDRSGSLWNQYHNHARHWIHALFARLSICTVGWTWWSAVPWVQGTASAGWSTCGKSSFWFEFNGHLSSTCTFNIPQSYTRGCTVWYSPFYEVSSNISISRSPHSFVCFGPHQHPWQFTSNNWTEYCICNLRKHNTYKLQIQSRTEEDIAREIRRGIALPHECWERTICWDVWRICRICISHECNISL